MKRRRSLVLVLLATGVLSLASVGTARAGLVLDFSGGNTDLVLPIGVTARTAGWSFDVTATLVVTELGMWDESPNGLDENHPVGLWNGDGSVLLASTVITNASRPSPSGLSTDGRWLFNSIGLLVLPPGTYVLGAFYHVFIIHPGVADFQTRQAASATTMAGVTFGGARFSDGPFLSFPSSIDPTVENDGEFGPNLATPAPLSLVLLGLGVAGIAARQARRRS